jgi:2-methylisocitrate lyase-like PEP mutase family enzyme
MEQAKKLREMMAEGMVVAPFCMDAFHAKIAQVVGFKAAYMTGWGTSAARGFPDVGLLTQTEVIQAARYIANAVDIPVICDADTGYGNPINMQRTMREYESTGAAAIHIEDQLFPKKCGFMAGKRVIPMEEYVQKLKAAIDARQDDNFIIIARCDALAVNGWEDTVRRCHAYYEAGADLIFVDGIKTREDLETYATRLHDLPRLYNAASVYPPISELAEMGFKINIHILTLPAVYLCVKKAFQELKETGNMAQEFIDFDLNILQNLMGLQEIYELEKRYQV